MNHVAPRCSLRIDDISGAVVARRMHGGDLCARWQGIWGAEVSAHVPGGFECHNIAGLDALTTSHAT